MIKIHTKFIGTIFTILMAALLFNACSDDNGTNPQNKLNIAETVQAQSNLSSLSSLLSTHKLTDTLSQEGPITLFAPDNDAMATVNLADSTDSMTKLILEYHIVRMNLTYENLQNKDSSTAETLNGDTLYFTTKGDSVIINGGQAVIISKGTEATNGTIFTLDTLLTAPSK